jgi:clan AA aspartic protease
MITGVVNADLEATIRLTMQAVGGQPHEIEAVIDTGFSGFLTLPPALITALRATWLSRQPGLLADGNVHIFDVHATTVLWDGQPRTVETEVVDAQPLVGMALLEGCDLWIHMADGGKVTIETNRPAVEQEG